MEFRKTLKKRLGFNIFYLVLGVTLIVTAFVTKSDNDLLYGFGTALAAIGTVMGIRNYRLMRSSEACKHREIAEKDERNIMLAHKARSWAFGLYIMGAGIAIITLTLIEKHEIVQILSWSVCALVALYWGSYLILQKKN